MCGITAYCGNGEALPFLMQGLAKLEYRGYDSAGVTVLNNDWSCRYWSYKMGNSWCPF